MIVIGKTFHCLCQKTRPNDNKSHINQTADQSHSQPHWLTGFCTVIGGQGHIREILTVTVVFISSNLCPYVSLASCCPPLILLFLAVTVLRFL